MRSTAKPAPSNVKPSRTTRPDAGAKKPSTREIYNRAGRRAAPTSKSPVRDGRYAPTRSYRPSDTVRSGTPRSKPRTTVATPSRVERYRTARPGTKTPGLARPNVSGRAVPRTNRPRTNSRTPTPRLIPRSSARPNRYNTGLTGTRIATGRTSRLYGGGYGSVYSSWWDPCYSSRWGWGSNWTLHSGFGCYGAGVSLWYPWYLSTTFGWSSHYSNCWWNTWSSPYWSPSRYWWYPSSTYCPTYLYVPSQTVVIETEADPEGEVVVEPEPVEEIPAAEPAAEPAGKDAPDLATKYIELGDFYFKAGRFAEAADAYARARTYAPDDAALHFVLADSAFAIGDYHFAAFLIAEGLRLDPALASAKADKREFYGDAKLFDEHMAALDKYVADKPYDASAQLVRGYNLNFSDRPTAAIAAFRRVLEIAPGHRAAETFLATLVPEVAEEPSIR